MTQNVLTEFNALYSIEIYINARRKAEIVHILAPNPEGRG